MCGLAPLALAAAMAAGPMCPRLDREASPVMAALLGEAVPAARTVDPAFEAAIRAIRPAPQPRKRRTRR
jgi:hypothetical protein